MLFVTKDMHYFLICMTLPINVNPNEYTSDGSNAWLLHH
jgi:hypothetical protein